MTDLERFIHAADSDLPPPVRVALIHAQFETIDPFLDGNGRIGRLLIAALLEHWGLLRQPLMVLCGYLKQHQAEYYRRLSAIGSEGDWEGSVSFFLESVAAAAMDAERSIIDAASLITAGRRRLLESAKARPIAYRLFEMLPMMPRFSVEHVRQRLATTFPTASAAVKLLEDLGILVELTGQTEEPLLPLPSVRIVAVPLRRLRGLMDKSTGTPRASRIQSPPPRIEAALEIGRDRDLDAVVRLAHGKGGERTIGGWGENGAGAQVEGAPGPRAARPAARARPAGEAAAIVGADVLDGVQRSIHPEHRDRDAVHIATQVAALGQFAGSGKIVPIAHAPSSGAACRAGRQSTSPSPACRFAARASTNNRSDSRLR